MKRLTKKIDIKSRSQFAEDISKLWKKAVRDAEHSVVVFTPFLDNSLITLLKEAEVGSDQITLITECSALTLLESPAQLKTLKKLLASGELSMYYRLKASMTDMILMRIGLGHIST
jgi:hypothetical protein